MIASPPPAGHQAFARERKRAVDAAWLLIFSIALLALYLPYATGAAPWDMPHIARDLGIIAGGYLALTAIAEKIPLRALPSASTALAIASVLALAWIWSLAGGMQAPAFLFIFFAAAIPAMLASVAFQSLLVAGTAIVAVWIVAIAQSETLHWYLLELGVPKLIIGPIAQLPLPRPVNAFANAPADPAWDMAMLLMVSAGQIAAALLTSVLSALQTRLTRRLRAYTDLTVEAQGLMQALLASAPEPTAVVYADTFQVLNASESFLRRALLTADVLPGKTLFDLIAFSDANGVREKLSTGRGMIPLCQLRIGTEPLVANLHCYRTTHRGNHYLHIHLQEITDLYYFRSAFDAVDEALLIVGDDGLLLYSNTAARTLFGELYLGKNMETTLRECGLLPDSLARAPERTRRVAIDSQPYQLRVSSAQLGDAGRYCGIFWLKSLRRESELESQLDHDPLTGAFSRRAFQARLDEATLADDAGNPLVLSLWDLDHFKEINDQHGHPAGDEYLKAFVHIASAHLRASDCIARLGGDEFAVLFPGVRLEQAQSLVSRILDALRRAPVRLGSVDQLVQASVGITVFRSGESPEDFIQRADEALYAAKHRRRGCYAVRE